MEAILLELLHRIATSRDLVSISLAAGVAHEQVLALMDTKDTNPEEQVPQALEV